MSTFKRTLFLSLLPLLSASAQSERYGPLTLQLPVSARGLSLGGSVMALGSVDAALGNPSVAGLEPGAALTLARYGPGTKAGVVSTSLRSGGFGIGVGVQVLDLYLTGDFPTPSRALGAIRGVRGESLVGSVAVAHDLFGLRVGGAAKAVAERVIGDRLLGPAFDVGISKGGIADVVTAELVVQNIGPRLSLGTLRADLPTRVSLGFSGDGAPLGDWFTYGAAASLAVLRNGFFAPSAGAELSWSPLEGVAVSGRAGVRRPELIELRPLTLGLGATMDRVSVDYAWESTKDGGAHRLTLRVR